MKRTNLKGKILAALLAAGCVCCTAGISAAAITVDDVAQKAREVGYSEELIQMGYNEWATGMYTQADLEAAYAALGGYDDQVNDKIDSIFDTDSAPSSTPSTEPEHSGGADSAPDASSSDSTQSTTEKSVTSVDFINMTLDEKIAYVNSMNPEDKEKFLNNLSTEERNSIIKQMSLDDKAELMQGYVDAAQKMNMNLVVDSLSDDGIAVTVRDNDGTIVDKTSVGITIDETGISYDGLLASAAAAVILSAAGIVFLYRYLCRTDGQAE